jgi:transketolase
MAHEYFLSNKKRNFVAEQKMDVTALHQKALQLRRKILEMTNTAGSGHPGGSLSAVEILITHHF